MDMKQIPLTTRYWQATLLAVLTLLLAACSSSDDYQWDPWDYSNAEKATVNVVAEDGTVEDLESGTTIGLYVTGDDGQVRLVSAKVDADGSIQLPSGALSGKVVVYAPFQSAWGVEAYSGNKLFEVQPDQSDEAGYEASDLMIGTATMTSKTRAASMALSMHHMLSKVMIHIVDETGALDMEKMTMRLLRMEGTVNVSLSNMSVSTVENSLLDIDMLRQGANDHRITMVAIVAPQTKAEGEKLFEFGTAGAQHICKLPSDATLEGGKTFVFQLRFTEEGLVPDSSYITNWEADDIETDLSVRVKK